jgi:CHAT domain-containing protein/Tfp pilus assembly protein PilF
VALPGTLASLVMSMALDVGLAADDAARFDALLAEGDRLSSQRVRRSDQALPPYREAIRLAEARHDPARAARAWAALGAALGTLYRYDESQAALERARALARRSGQANLETLILRRFGFNLVGQAEYEKGDQALDHAIELARRAGDGEQLVAALNTRSVSARHQGRLPEAEAFAREGLRELDRMLAEGRPVPEPSLFALPFNVGKSLADAGDYGAAMVYFDRAFQAAIQNKNIGAQWHVLHDTGEWYLSQGDLDRADRYFARALAFSRQHPELLESEADTLRGMGALAEARSDLREAARRYTEAVAAFRRIRWHGRVAIVLAALARVQSAAGDAPAAAASAREALRLATAQRQSLGQALARLELARQHAAAASFEKAEREYRASLEVGRANGIRPLESAALAGLASVAHARGDGERAIERYQAAASHIEGIRGRVLAPELRAAFARASHGTYAGLLGLLMERYRAAPNESHAADALMALERERGQNLLAALREAGAERRGPAREPSARRRQLERRVAQLQVQLAGDAPDTRRRRELLAELDDAERALAALEEDHAAPGDLPARSEGVGAGSDGLSAARMTLEPAEALIAYGPGVAFVVTRDVLKVVDLPPLEGLDARVEFFARVLAGAHPTDALPAGRALARGLLAPVFDVLPTGVRRLLFSVSGPLAGLPFAALPHPRQAETSHDRPLLDQFEVAYVASLAALAGMRNSRVSLAPRPLLAAAVSDHAATRRLPDGAEAGLDALPHTAREVRAIARHVEGEADVLLNAEASEAALKARRLRDFKVLHLATHALLDPQVPPRSAIVLAKGSEDEDGLLQSREIYGLELAAELVVLSACRTGAGRASSAEGLESLAQAFLYAGARSVVGTLWEIQDEAAAEAIERFYEALAEGEPVSGALRHVQRSSPGRDPYATAGTWAAFVVIGDPSARVALGRPGAPWGPRAWLAAAATVGLGLILWTTQRGRRRRQGARTNA